MKTLKIFLFLILGLIGIYAILCGMGPKKMATQRSMVINASPAAIFEEISNFDKWKAWSPWHQKDPKMVTKTTGTAGEKGHKQEWTSEDKNVGSGSQEYVEVRTNEYLKSEMKFKDWGDAASYSEFILKPEGEGTKVTWTMDGSEFPFMARGLMMLMGVEKSLEADFDNGLGQLKTIAEAKPKEPIFKYELVTMPDSWYVGQLHAGLAMSGDLKSVFESSYGAIGEAIGGMEKATGHPFCIARKIDYDTKMMDLEMAMPVATEMKVADGLTSGKIPAGRTIQYLYYGPYEGTEGAWAKLMTAMEKDGLKPRWDGYEVYTNDPMIVKDPAKFETLLIQPVD